MTCPKRRTVRFSSWLDWRNFLPSRSTSRTVVWNQPARLFSSWADSQISCLSAPGFDLADGGVEPAGAVVFELGGFPDIVFECSGLRLGRRLVLAANDGHEQQKQHRPVPAFHGITPNNSRLPGLRPTAIVHRAHHDTRL